MYVEVIYFDTGMNAYTGRGYTYKTELPLKLFEKVLCPTYKGMKKGLVTRVDVPEAEVDPSWADRIQLISERDKG